MKKQIQLILLLSFLVIAQTAKARNCITFTTQLELNNQKSLWYDEFGKMEQKDLFDLLIGMKMPSKKLLSETKRQKECLIQQITSILQREGKKIPARTTISGFRGYKKQNAIWNRKFSFKGYSFDKISEKARNTCGRLIKATDFRWTPKNRNHTKCWKRLSPDRRQQEILQASAAPGLSRHHWGTEFDLFDPELLPENWKKGKRFHFIYQELQQQALKYGYFQPYGDLKKRNYRGYFEERWHWSYFPAAEALLDVIRKNKDEFQSHLETYWGNHPRYSYIRSEWIAYVFGINSATLNRKSR